MTSKTIRIKRPRIRNTCDDGTGGGRVVVAVVVNIVVVVVVTLWVVAVDVVVINLAVEEDNITVVVGLVKNFLVEPATLPTVGKFFGLSFVVGLNVVVFMVLLVSLDDMLGPCLGLGCDVTICCCC